MKKKLIIAGCVVLGIIALVVILLFTLFALRRVEVNFRSSVSQDCPTQEQILEAGQFSYGSPVPFLSKNKFAENIEKTYPTIDVVNIETVFPNKLVVHVRERVNVFAFVHNRKTYICDNNLVVLQVIDSDSYTSTIDNEILLSGLVFSQDEYKPGDKLLKTNYVDFYQQLLTVTSSSSLPMKLIEKIEYFMHKDNYTLQESLAIKIHTFAGNDYYIYNAQKNLSYKASKFWTAFSSLYSTYLGTTIRHIDPEDDDDLQVWTQELLSDAVILIDDYYKVTDKNNPVYANVLLKSDFENNSIL